MPSRPALMGATEPFSPAPPPKKVPGRRRFTGGSPPLHGPRDDDPGAPSREGAGIVVKRSGGTGLEVPVLVLGRGITRIFGGCGGAVPSACHSEKGCFTCCCETVARSQGYLHELKGPTALCLTWRSLRGATE